MNPDSYRGYKMPLKKIICLLCLVVVSKATFGQNKSSQVKSRNEPFVLGIVDTLSSTILKEKRILNIYLPDGYNSSDTTRYPVVYLLDGAHDEDFIHVVGLYYYNSFPWVNRVPKSIIVGIANTKRTRDFTFPTSDTTIIKRNPDAGESGKFISFLEEELKPFIEKKYRTQAEKTIIGQSLGGLLLTQILFQKPRMFDKYIIISPSIWWDNRSILKQEPEILKASFQQPVNVYLGVGKEGLTPGVNPGVMEVDVNLLAEKLRSAKNKSLTIHFDYLPQEDHATVIYQALFNALRMIYPAPPPYKE